MVVSFWLTFFGPPCNYRCAFAFHVLKQLVKNHTGNLASKNTALAISKAIPEDWFSVAQGARPLIRPQCLLA